MDLLLCGARSKTRVLRRLLCAAGLLLIAASACMAGLSSNVHLTFYQWHRTLDYDGYWRHWDGTNPPEDIAAVNYPLLDPYSSCDPAVVEKQMEWIKRAGIGVVLLDIWNTGSYEETPTLGSMNAAAAKGIKCGFYIEPWRHPDGTFRNIRDVEEQIRYVYDTYGNHPAAYKISRPTRWGTSDKPRLVFYSFAALEGIPESDYAAYLDRVRGTDYDPFFIGSPANAAFITNAHWDGVTNYDGFFPPDQFRSVNNSAVSAGGVFSPSVCPGFDNTRIGGVLVKDRQNGATYDNMWNYARNAATEFVSITSFNEYGEGTVIEPVKPKSIPGYTYQDFGSLGPFWYLDRTMYWKNAWQGTALDQAAYMADSIPSALEAGETRMVSVVVMNTGDTTWTSAGEYKLGGYGDYDPFADTRHYMDPSASVRPFETYTFTFPFTAPSTPGTYHTDWQMVRELVRWFGDIRPYKDIEVYAPGEADDAEYVSDTIPESMVAGRQYNVSITLRNAGTRTWERALSYGLRTTGSQDPFSGGLYYLDTGETVPPGSEKTFSFIMTAPQTAGYYMTAWRMARGSTTRFGAECKRIVLVTDPGSIPPVTEFAAAGGDGRIALSWTNPADYDLTRTMVRWKTTGFPTDPTDGQLLVDKPGTPESEDGWVHTGLASGTNCYYAAFAHDGIGNYSTAATAVTAAWSLPRVTLSASTFNSGPDGWATAVWRAGSYSNGTMSWNGSAGNPSGAMRSTGAGTSDDTDRCKREGGEILGTISTAGYRNIKVSYDVRVNALGGSYTGTGSGSCQVDHNLVDEQLTVYYSTDGGAHWTQADWLTRAELLASYRSYGRREIDLSWVAGANDNPGFALRFRWQFNTASDTGDLDNIVVTGTPADVLPPASVTDFAAVAGDGEVTLSWTNPADPDFTGTMIRYKTTGFPTDPKDGILLADRVNKPGSTDSAVHTGLTNGTTYYYSAFARDYVPNYAAPAGAIATAVVSVCLFDDFSYPNGKLNGNGGWAGTATSLIAVENGVVKLIGDLPQCDAAVHTSCSGGSDGLGVWIKAKRGVGTTTIWNLWIDDPAGNALARWYGSGTAVRGRIVAGNQITPARSLTGGWDDLYIYIDPASNESRFFMNGALLGTLDHTESGAGDMIGRIRLESTYSTGSPGAYLYFDDLKVGLADMSPPAAAAMSAPSVTLARTGPVSYTVDFSEPVHGFNAASDIQVNSAGSAAAGSVSVTGSGAGPYVVTLSQITGEGALGITIKQGACTDAAGNPNIASSPSATFRVLARDGSIAAAKLLEDGDSVDLGNKALYLVREGFGYIEEPDRSCGIRIEGTITASEGELVCLAGVVRTGPGGERYIRVSKISPAGPYAVDPLGAGNYALKDALMEGLYVKAWGVVKPGSITGGSYVISDGSDTAGIRVFTPGAPEVSEGEYVTVTGAAGREGARVIYAR